MTPLAAQRPSTSFDLTNWSLRPSYIGEPATLLVFVFDRRAQSSRCGPGTELASPKVADLAFVDETILEPVRRLPDKQPQAVTLRVLGDLTHREVAEVMQISEAAARRNVFGALRRLRAQLEPSPTTGGPSP